MKSISFSNGPKLLFQFF